MLFPFFAGWLVLWGAQEQDCVVCLEEPRDTLVLPCRHLCLCLTCAKALASTAQGNNCPIW